MAVVATQSNEGHTKITALCRRTTLPEQVGVKGHLAVSVVPTRAEFSNSHKRTNTHIHRRCAATVP